MMPIHFYRLFYNGLLTKNLQLINDPDEYKNCYYLPESYSLFKELTPKTLWLEGQNYTCEKLKEIAQHFNGRPVIVKDYVKSQKHNWFDACFIPDPTHLTRAKQIIDKFIELQGENFQGGLVFREYLKLEAVGIHPKSNMPLTKEYRIFVLRSTPISIIRYWNDVCYENPDFDISQFNSIISRIRSNFFTLDIAKVEDGGWVIMELGDAQVAEYMDVDSLDFFYQKLSKIC